MHDLCTGGLADLNEADPNGIENEPVGEPAAGDVAPDGFDRVQDVLECRPGGSQRNRVPEGLGPYPRLQAGHGSQVDLHLQDALQRALQR
ncbi:MAG: hypothetical protein NVS3B26_28260 [Mycobacteriales bacterium]